MATHRMSLLNGATLPGTSGNVWFEPLSVSGSNDFWQHGGFAFGDTATKDPLYGAAPVPMNYVGAPSVYPEWSGTVTSGTVQWEFAYRCIAGDGAASMDQATAAETILITDAAPGTSLYRMLPSGTLTPGSVTAGALMEWRLSRVGTAVADNMAAKALLSNLLLEYTDA